MENLKRFGKFQKNWKISKNVNLHLSAKRLEMERNGQNVWITCNCQWSQHNIFEHFKMQNLSSGVMHASFWRNNVISKLTLDCVLSLMTSGISPIWSQNLNVEGKFIYTIQIKLFFTKWKTTSSIYSIEHAINNYWDAHLHI